MALPPYVSEYRDRHGKARLRFRRTGWKTAYPKERVGTVEFTEEYHAWLNDARVQPGAGRITPGSFDDLIARYYRSTEWSDLKKTTQVTYRNQLERFRAVYGDRTVATMTARHLSTLMTQKIETPSAANNLRKRLSQLFDYAIILGWRKDNPARAVRSLRTRKGGFPTWQEEQIAIFEAKFPRGTMARLAFDLALYTAQRRSDVRPMGPKDIERGKIRVRQLKTGKHMMIPIHAELAKTIAASSITDEVFVTTERGAAYQSDASFGNWFSHRCVDAGLKGFSMHGLRKAASRRMAEMGLSNQLIKSITGHTSDSEVSRYTREAEQEAMADRAMEIMSLANFSK